MTAKKRTNMFEVQEIQACLQQAFARVSTTAATEAWTFAALTALANLGERHELRVDPPRWTALGRDDGKAGEFLWDLALSSWPASSASNYKYPGYYERACQPSLARLHLAAESEWGKSKSPGATGLAVMEDFAKLLAARCDVKVMVFAYHRATGNGSFDELQNMMARLVAASDDPATYVLYGLDWKSTESRSVAIVNRRPGEPLLGSYGERPRSK